MELDKKKKIVQSPSLVEVFLKTSPEIFEENKFELAEYSLVNGYIDSFTLIFEKFYPNILILFEFGFKRDYTELLTYDEYARRHKNYLKCFLPKKLKEKIYGK